MTDDIPAGRSRGRPAKYSRGLATAICAAIANGRSVRQACAAQGISWTVMYSWRDQYPEFAKQFAAAQVARTEHMAEEIIEIADNSAADVLEYEASDGHIRAMPNHAAAARDRLRCENRKWLMQKWNPQKFGDTNRLELTGAYGGPILLEQITLVAVKRLEAERSSAISEPQVIDAAGDDDGHLPMSHTPSHSKR
jgi:transposase-like protein